MDFNGLSTDQAPPISAPLRFFLTAPLFGIIAGILIFFSDAASMMSRYSYESVAVTHAITIGFLGMVMLGALTQMLPVLAGAKIPKVLQISRYSHALLFIGTLSMLAGILWSSPLLNTLALVALGGGFIIILSAIALGIKSVKNFTPTIKAMSASIIFAFLIVLMGLYLLYAYITNSFSEYHHIVANVHSVWGIFGFAGILIIGVSFQVLPMFYVAPRFKKFCKQKVLWLITFGLLLWMFLNIFFESYSIAGKFWVALFFWAFSTTVWKKLNNRRRPLSDVTVWYWRSSSIFLTLGSFLWIFDEYFANEYTVLVSLFIGGGFILSIMIGMLYKIIPFLVWFHLNAHGYMSIPTINEMINKNLARVQFALFLVSLIGFVLSFFIPVLLKFFALTFILSMIFLQINIIAPVLIYIKTKKTKPDFDMSAFTTDNEG
ncbi:hypothetical protein KJ877_01980 [bacterium]|nr:hypothetical protein [bacterium]MBU1989363.1 hypothetical protein [bacterium]